MTFRGPIVGSGTSWEEIARRQSELIFRYDSDRKKADLRLDEFHSVILRVEGLLEKHLLDHAKANGSIHPHGSYRSLPNLDEWEIVTSHGTKRSPESYEEWEAHKEVATWKGIKRFSLGALKIAIGGLLLVVSTVILTHFAESWAAHPTKVEVHP